MNLFTKIYGLVLVLFAGLLALSTFQISSRRIEETEKLLLSKQRITGKLVTSEIRRWHAEGKWPFEALSNLAQQEDFLFWWIVDDHGAVFLADNVEFVGTDAAGYFPEMAELLRSQDPQGVVVLNRGRHYGIFAEVFRVGSERWTFGLGFSTRTLAGERNRIIASTVLYSLVGMALLGVVLFLAIRRFLRPLKDLGRGAERIGRGELDVRVAVGASDEVGIVSTAFNQMAESLQRDIARRTEVERELKHSEELYRSLVENINMGITLVDRDFNVVMTNAAQGRMFRKDARDFFGKKCFREFEKRDEVCAHCPGVAAMENGRTQEVLAEGTRDDGSTFTVTVKAFPLQAEDGAAKGFIEVVEDVTERLKAQEDLAAEKERLAVTLRSIGDGVITTDVDGTVVLLNKVAENLTGWSTDEAVGRPLEQVFRIINEQTREACENPVEKVLGSGLIIGLANHTVLVARDGTERSIADSGAPILDTRSRIIGVVLVFRDVTEQNRTEMELLKIKKLESIGVLAGGIAHDFNNILAAILGNISIVLFKENLPPQVREILAEAEKASLRAKGLTQQLLTFAKGGEPVRETSSLEGVIRDSASFVLHGGKAGCRFEFPADPWLVDIDRGQISQVIQNVVLNASHAMPEGGTILISCVNLPSLAGEKVANLRDGRYVRISVKDTGIGIPENLLEKIFDPYFTTKQQGSGLGLAITQSIVHKHEGVVTVDSSPGVGTTFSIYLPASREQIRPPAGVREQKEKSRRARVLVMDDEAMVREVARAMLDELGHEVVLSADGAETLRLYREALAAGRRFDVVIVDLTIPGGMGGAETTCELLKFDPDARVVVSSGYSNDPVMANFKAHGFSAAIVKPYQIQELGKVLQRALG